MTITSGHEPLCHGSYTADIIYPQNLRVRVRNLVSFKILTDTGGGGGADLSDIDLKPHKKK